MTARARADALAAVLRGVPNLRVYTNPAAVVDPPGAVLAPPTLGWETFATDPVRATFVVYLVTSLDDRALDRLLDLVPAVAAALATDPEFAAMRAEPGVWTSGGTDLPAYLLTVETTL